MLIPRHLVWADILPKPIPIPAENRSSRLAQEKEQRKCDRKRKLEQLVKNIAGTEPPLIQAHILRAAPHSSSDSNAPAIPVSHKRLFPLTEELLAFPLIKSLAETDVSASGMEARFDRHREDIKALILEWRIKTEGYMADLIRKGRVSDGLDGAAPAPKLLVGASEPNPFDGVSDDLKLLLRADSLFESAHWPKTPVTYDVLLKNRDYWSRSDHEEEGSDSDEVRPLDLSKCKRHVKAQEVAQALLKGIGKPDACFLGFQSVGPLFKCGRCRSASTHSWEYMVRSSSSI